MSPPNASVDDDFRWIMERVRADLPREVTPPRLLLDPTFAAPAHPACGEDPSDAVVEIGANRKRIGLEHGREAACLAVMSAVQDAVIDETGSPWPEVVGEDGRAVGVLDVHADPHGHAVWTLGGDVVCPLLATAVFVWWRRGEGNAPWTGSRELRVPRRWAVLMTTLSRSFAQAWPTWSPIYRCPRT